MEIKVKTKKFFINKNTKQIMFALPIRALKKQLKIVANKKFIDLKLFPKEIIIIFKL